MHIANRVLEYISTADKLINSDEYEYYNWRFGKIAYKKTGEGCIISMYVLLPMNGETI